MENNFIEEQLRKTLQAFEAEPDSNSFEAILEKMNKKKKRRAFIIFFMLGFTLLIALSCIIFSDLFDDLTKYSLKQNIRPEVQEPSDTKKIHSHSINIEPGVIPKQENQPNPSAYVAAAGSENGTRPSASSTRLSNKALPNSSINRMETKQYAALQKKRKISQATSQKSINEEPTIEKPVGNAETTAEEDPYINPLQPDSINNIPMHLSPLMPNLPHDQHQPDINVSLKEVAPKDSVLKGKRTRSVSFYSGITFNPQLNNFIYSKNPNPGKTYHSQGTNSADTYVDAKQQNRYQFTVPFGLKVGFQINNTYEVFAGFGVQSFKEKEKVNIVGPPPTASLPTGLPHEKASSSNTYINVFRYYSYSLEANRLFHVKKAVALKIGLSLYANQFRDARYIYAQTTYQYLKASPKQDQLSPWLLTAKVKGGVILNAHKRFQVHLSPGFFYSPTSVFGKAYVIRQKPYGFDLECSLLFRLFRIR